jgi:hypothetical protein
MNEVQWDKAFGNAILSGISATMAWISIKDAQVMVTFGASLVAVASGFFAARYYWYATKEKKANLKKLKSNP